MSEKSKGQTTVAVELPAGGYRKRMFFNRFMIAPEGDFRLLHFGYVSGGNLLVDHFVCAIHFAPVERQRAENLDYLGKLGDLTLEEPEKWQPPAGQFEIELVNIMGLARHGSEAEIAMHNYSAKAMIDFSRVARSPGAVLAADAVALLRSDFEIHKHFIRTLYARPT